MSEAHREHLLLRLKALAREEEEIKLMVQSVDASLLELGYQVQNPGGENIVPQTGIRLHDQLSFRGKQKAEEYFKFADTDRDGLLNFEDIRAMKAFSNEKGLAHTPEFSNWESFKLFMDDNCIAITPRGEMSVDGFLRYREMVEMEQPLSKELEYFNLGFLPEKLMSWANLKKLIRELLVYRVSILTITQKKGVDLSDDSLTLDEVAYLLGNNGVAYSKLEVMKMMADHSIRLKLFASLIRKYSKKNLSEQTYDFKVSEEGKLVLKTNMPGDGTTVVSDFARVKPYPFISWAMSFPLLINPRDYLRRLLAWKYKFFNFARYVDDWSKVMFTYAGHMNDRLVFRDFPIPFRLSKVNQEVSTLKFGISVGDEDRREGGMSFNWKMIKMDTPAQVLKKFRLPHECGFAGLVEFLLNDTASEDAAIRLAQLTKQFLSYHFEKELRSNRQFMGFYVYPGVNENDGSKVLRVGIAYKRIVSFDGMMEHMLIPYKVCDLVATFAGEMRTNFDLSSFLHDTTTSVSDAFCGTFEVTAVLKKNLILSLLQRTVLAVTAALTKEQATVKESEKKAKADAAKAAEEEPDEDAPVDYSNAAAQKAAKLKKTEEDLKIEEEQRFNRWHSVHTYFPTIALACSYIISTLQGIRTTSWKFKYSSIGEWLFKAGLTMPWLRQAVPDESVYRPGYIKEAYFKFCDAYMAEFGEIHRKAEKFLVDRKNKELARRKAEIMQGQSDEDKAKEAERITTMEQMKRLGMSAAESSAMLLEDIPSPDDPNAMEKSLTEEESIHNVQGLELIEYWENCVTGPYTFEIFSGCSRLSGTFSGMDWVELLPQLPSIAKVKAENSLKKK